MLIESRLEFQQCQPQLLDRVEGARPQQLLLEGADEPLGHAIAFGRPHEARAGFDAQKGDLMLKMVAHVLRPVVVPKDQSISNTLTEPPRVYRRHFCLSRHAAF